MPNQQLCGNATMPRGGKRLRLQLRGRLGWHDPEVGQPKTFYSDELLSAEVGSSQEEAHIRISKVLISSSLHIFVACWERTISRKFSLKWSTMQQERCLENGTSYLAIASHRRRAKTVCRVVVTVGGSAYRSSGSLSRHTILSLIEVAQDSIPLLVLPWLIM